MVKSCATCKHLITHRMCKAFPDGIPIQIIAGDVGHIEPYPGDNGIQFEPLAGKDDINQRP